MSSKVNRIEAVLLSQTRKPLSHQAQSPSLHHQTKGHNPSSHLPKLDYSFVAPDFQAAPPKQNSKKVPDLQPQELETAKKEALDPNVHPGKLGVFDTTAPKPSPQSPRAPVPPSMLSPSAIKQVKTAEPPQQPQHGSRNLAAGQMQVAKGPTYVVPGVDGQVYRGRAASNVQLAVPNSNTKQADTGTANYPHKTIYKAKFNTYTKGTPPQPPGLAPAHKKSFSQLT